MNGQEIYFADAACRSCPVQTAFIMINCESGHESCVVEHLREMAGVREVMRTWGVYDAVATIECSTIEDLKATIKQVRKMPHVSSTTTLVRSRIKS